MATTSSDITARLAVWLEEAARGVAFPGRVRVFCDESLAGILPPAVAAQRDCPGARGALLLAAACGTAWVEAGRGGRVAMIAERIDDAGWWEAVVLAGRLAGPLRLILVGGSAADLVRYVQAGWNADGPLVQLWPAVPPTATVALPRLRREWPPVRLASLPAGGLPPWPPALPLSDWLPWLVGREPALLLPDLAAGWCALPPSASVLMAAGAAAGDGWRVCWRLPRGSDLSAWLPALAEIGRRGLALKLLLDAADAVPMDRLHALHGWWLLAPADVGETAAVLTAALDNDDPTLIALPGASSRIPAWLPERSWQAGTARRLAEGGRATLVCDGRTASAAMVARDRLADAGITVGVLSCTSLLPLPVAALEQAAAHGPLVACGNLAGLMLAVLDGVPVVRAAEGGWVGATVNCLGPEVPKPGSSEVP